MGLHKGKESSEVSVNLPYSDIDQIKENRVNSSGCAAKSVFLRAKTLEAKGKSNWRKILAMTKNVREAVTYAGISVQSFCGTVL